MEEMLIDWLNPPKPIKCQHCGLERGKHRAQTFQCPAKWSRGRAVGYTHFLETVYAPKKPKVRPSPTKDDVSQ